MDNKDTYRRIKDFPSHIDEDFYDYVDDVEAQRTILREMILEIIQQNKNSLITVGVLVGVLNRQLECSMASIFLLSRKFFRDGAILALTLMELRLDLEYIAKDVENEMKWISQEKHNKKIWRVSDQIKAVAKNEKEESADYTTYKFLSIIKHGNPAVGHLSFKISAKPDRIVVDEGNNSVDPKQILGILSIQINKSLEAVLIISERNGIDLSTFKPRMIELENIIGKRVYDNLMEIVKSYISKKNK